MEIVLLPTAAVQRRAVPEAAGSDPKLNLVSARPVPLLPLQPTLIPTILEGLQVKSKNPQD